jgi:hypothetical protein
VPPELAELIFEVQETLEELRGSASEGDGEARLRTRVAARRQAVEGSLGDAFTELERNFAK